MFNYIFTMLCGVSVLISLGKQSTSAIELYEEHIPTILK